jgi:hypothetical protein
MLRLVLPLRLIHHICISSDSICNNASSLEFLRFGRCWQMTKLLLTHLLAIGNIANKSVVKKPTVE